MINIDEFTKDLTPYLVISVKETLENIEKQAMILKMNINQKYDQKVINLRKGVFDNQLLRYLKIQKDAEKYNIDLSDEKEKFEKIKGENKLAFEYKNE